VAKTYVTFGSSHVHRINGHTIDKDCVAIIECKNAEDGRSKAFEFFNDKFCFEYPEEYFNIDSMKYFPRGFIKVN